MGSEFYAYFVVESEQVASRELEELADDAGGADLPQQEGNQIVARLDAASKVRQGQDTELWFNCRAPAAVRPRDRQDAAGEQRRRPLGAAADGQSAGAAASRPAGAARAAAGRLSTPPPTS